MRFIQESEWEYKGCHFEILAAFIRILHDLIHCASLIWFARGGRIYLNCLFDNMFKTKQWLFQHNINPQWCLLFTSYLGILRVSIKYVRGSYGWLRLRLLDWFVAPQLPFITPLCAFPTVSFCSTYSSSTLSLCLLGSLYRGRLRVVNIYINIGQKQVVTLALPLG